MFKGIFIYCLLVFCLLSKDGINFCLDALQDTNSITWHVDLGLQDSIEEEDASEDWWFFTSSGLENMPEFSVNSMNKNTVVSSDPALLNVLLEQVSPPPRMV